MTSLLDQVGPDRARLNFCLGWAGVFWPMHISSIPCYILTLLNDTQHQIFTAMMEKHVQPLRDSMLFPDNHSRLKATMNVWNSWLSLFLYIISHTQGQQPLSDCQLEVNKQFIICKRKIHIYQQNDNISCSLNHQRNSSYMLRV